MKRLELLIAARDEPEAHRKKEGDIIDVKPHPWRWGKKEVTNFLIVPVMAGPEDRKYDFKQMGETEKRRYQVPLDILEGWMPDLNKARVRDKSDNYQPFKEQGRFVDMREKVAFVKDKQKGGFKYGKLKKTAEQL